MADMLIGEYFDVWKSYVVWSGCDLIHTISMHWVRHYLCCCHKVHRGSIPSIPRMGPLPWSIIVPCGSPSHKPGIDQGWKAYSVQNRGIRSTETVRAAKLGTKSTKEYTNIRIKYCVYQLIISSYKFTYLKINMLNVDGIINYVHMIKEESWV